jgi:hypothetical protein
MGRAAPETARDVLLAVLSTLDDRQQQVMKLRMGFETKPRTLQEIGDLYQVTRERIRQIEAKVTTRVGGWPLWDEMFRPRLQSLMAGRKDPLPLSGLEVLDPWFVGIDAMPHAFEYVLDHFVRGTVSLIRAGGETFVSRLQPDEWEVKLREARAIMESAAASHTSEEEARHLVGGILVGTPGEELQSVLWQQATRWANFAQQGDKRVLVSYGYGLERFVEAVLLESDTPLHYTEIAKRCSDRRGGSKVDLRRAQNSAANVGLLFALGTYGLARHIPLSDAEMRTLTSAAEEIVESDHARQWHAREIVDLLAELDLEFEEKIDHYLVCIALSKSDRVVDLGRMVWASRASGARGVAERIDVRQAVAALIEREGRPMHIREIRETILRERGLNDFFQVHQHGALVRIAPSTWGLINRDLPFPVERLPKLLGSLEDALRMRGKGVHISEVTTSLSCVAEATNADPTLLFGIAERDERFKVDKGQYLYLTEWGGSRRPTIQDAIRQVLRAAGRSGVTVGDAADQVEALLERPINRRDFAGVCRRLGDFDPATETWRFADDDLAEGARDAAPTGEDLASLNTTPAHGV